MESTEIQLARLDERMRMILDRMEENHDSQMQIRAWMGQVDRTLHDINSRVSGVENSLSKSAPTIAEFIEIKNKVLGAGTLGRWLWIALGSILGYIISAKTHLIQFFTGQGS